MRSEKARRAFRHRPQEIELVIADARMRHRAVPVLQLHAAAGETRQITSGRVIGCLERRRDNRVHAAAADVFAIGQHLKALAECVRGFDVGTRSEEHTSELQSLMRISYAVFCLKKKT